MHELVCIECGDQEGMKTGKKKAGEIARFLFLLRSRLL